MEILIRGTVLSLILAMSCRIFYDTIADGREWRHSLTGGTVLPAFLLAFFFIAFTEIPQIGRASCRERVSSPV